MTNTQATDRADTAAGRLDATDGQAVTDGRVPALRSIGTATTAAAEAGTFQGEDPDTIAAAHRWLY